MAATSGKCSTLEHKRSTQRREEQEADDRRECSSQSLSPAAADDLNTSQAGTGRNHDREDEEEQTRSKPGNERRSIEALVQDVERCKNRGNVEFFRGRALSAHTAGRNILSDACLLYAEGIKALAQVDARLSVCNSNATGSEDGCRDEEGTMVAELRSRAKSLGSALYLNLAAVNLLLNEWDPALACCTHVIETKCGDAIAAAAGAVETAAPASLGPEARRGRGKDTVGRLNDVAAKALYRRSAARLGIGGDEDAIAARNDLLLALKLKPGDANVQRELAKVEKTIASAEAKEKLCRETEDGRRRQQRRWKEDEVARADESVSRRPDASSTSAPTPTQPAVNNDVEAVASSITTPIKSRTGGDGDVVADDGNEGGHGRSAGGDNCEERDDDRSSSERLDTEGSVKILEAEKRSDEWVEEDEERFLTWNGGWSRNRLYAWNQSVFEVQVCVKVPVWAQARDIRVDMRRLRLSVRIVSPGKPQTAADHTTAARVIAPTNTGDDKKPPAAGICEDVTTVILDGTLSRPVQAGECLWTMEKPGRVYLYLQKELAAEGKPGYEWWERVIDGDEGIDTTTCDAGCFASGYPEHVRRRGAKALWEDQRKSPAQRRADELNEARMREARRQVEKEAEQRQRDLDKALKDPKKAEMYRQLQKALPNTTISLK